jgi:hypothetical protein
MGDGDARDTAGAQHDAAEIVRLAFQQAERVTKQAEEDRIAAATARASAEASAEALMSRAEADATRIRAEAEASAEALRSAAEAERERLLADAKRERVLAEEVLIRARAEAEHEAEDVLARASQLARREAEILLEGSRMELLRARDEATAIRSAAERDAEAIIAAATTRARSTSAEILAATRRRIGDAPPGGGMAAREAAVGSLADDRPPPGPSTALVELAALTEFVTGRRPDALVDAIVEEVAVASAWHERRYRMNWPKTPREEDVANLVDLTISRAMAKVFAEPSLVHHDWSAERWLRAADADVIELLDVQRRRSA